MLLIISPAKSLDFSPPAPGVPASTPMMAADTAELAKATRKLKARDLKRLMSISDSLALLNYERFQAFDPDSEDGVQAALAFNGDVYAGLRARTLDKAALNWAQGHLRILSGLYGLLRPLDVIQPYRLEMGVRLKTRRGQSLYDFWGSRIAEQLNAAAEGHADPTLINLASQEYFASVRQDALRIPLLTCQFKELKDGEAKIVSFFAKKARGLMARYAIEGRLDRPEGLKDFTVDGYGFDAKRSNEREWVFVRPAVSPKGA
ncbi:MAG TPA: peroxide stress protein YaaA [Caulobacteraceae bacterium]|nr:peroxide stress protein YaaA [Caulobacteraceae bacterium]